MAVLKRPQAAWLLALWGFGKIFQKRRAQNTTPVSIFFKNRCGSGIQLSRQVGGSHAIKV